LSATYEPIHFWKLTFVVNSSSRSPCINEDARDYARSLKDTPEFEQPGNERKKVEMRFAHLKINHRFERMRLRGLTGARDEFHLAAIVQNLKALALPDKQAAACVT
jgi:hypothetical protein